MQPVDVSFKGRLFGPGIAGGGMPATGRWVGDVLNIHGQDMERQVPAGSLRIGAAGFNFQQTDIRWKNNDEVDDGEFAFFIDRPADQAAFASGAPASVVAVMGQGNRKRNGLHRRFRIVLSGYLVYSLLPVIAIALFFLNTDRIAEWAADKVPTKYEEQLSGMVLTRIKAEQKLVDSGPAVDAVRRIGTGFHPGSRYRYRWFVADSKDVNAFALPGGVVVVHAGLIREAGSAEELAGVLAHEVAHVERRHSLKALIKNAGFGILLSIVLGDVSGTTIAGWTSYLTQMKFSRDAEMEADREGVRRMVAAGIDPRAMLGFFDKMAEKEGKGAAALSVLATHPSSRQRMAALRELIADLPAKDYGRLPVDLDAVKAALPAK